MMTRSLIFCPAMLVIFPKAQGHYLERPQGARQLVLIYCISGSGWAQVGDVSVSIGAGQVLVIPPHIPHMYGAEAHDPWSIYWVHIAGDKTDTALRLLEMDTAKYVLSPGLDPAMPALFDRMIQALGSGYLADSLRASATALHQLISHLISTRHFQQGDKPQHDREISNAVDLMNRSLDRSLSLADLAASATMSTSHFAALFKKRTGFPPLDYFMRLKMQRACYLLDVTDLPIKEIAAQLGFDDPLYFSRRFRQIHNCSPTQYQAIQKG